MPFETREANVAPQTKGAHTSAVDYIHTSIFTITMPPEARAPSQYRLLNAPHSAHPRRALPCASIPLLHISSSLPPFLFKQGQAPGTVRRMQRLCLLPNSPLESFATTQFGRALHQSDWARRISLRCVASVDCRQALMPARCRRSTPQTILKKRVQGEQ